MFRPIEQTDASHAIKLCTYTYLLIPEITTLSILHTYVDIFTLR